MPRSERGKSDVRETRQFDEYPLSTRRCPSATALDARTIDPYGGATLRARLPSNDTVPSDGSPERNIAWPTHFPRVERRRFHFAISQLQRHERRRPHIADLAVRVSVGSKLSDQAHMPTLVDTLRNSPRFER